MYLVRVRYGENRWGKYMKRMWRVGDRRGGTGARCIAGSGGCIIPVTVSMYKK